MKVIRMNVKERAMPNWIKSSPRGDLLSILVAPRASSTRVIGEHDGWLKIALTCAPVDGRANKALINFISELFKVPKGDIEIMRGHKSKKKYIRVPSGCVIKILDPTFF